MQQPTLKLQRDVCRKDYISKDYLRAHMIIVHGGMNSCISCFNVMYTMCGEWGDEYLFLYLDRGYNFNNELFELLL